MLRTIRNIRKNPPLHDCRSICANIAKSLEALSFSRATSTAAEVARRHVRLAGVDRPDHERGRFAVPDRLSRAGPSRSLQGGRPADPLDGELRSGRFSDSPRAWSRSRRRGGAGWRLTWLLFRPGWKKNAPFASPARWQGRLPTAFPKKASESSLQAMVRLGTSSRSRYTGLGTEGTRGAPPRSHRPIQVRRTQAS